MKTAKLIEIIQVEENGHTQFFTKDGKLLDMPQRAFSDCLELKNRAINEALALLDRENGCDILKLRIVLQDASGLYPDF